MLTDSELILLANVMYNDDIASGRFYLHTLGDFADHFIKGLEDGSITHDDLRGMLSGGFPIIVSESGAGGERGIPGRESGGDTKVIRESITDRERERERAAPRETFNGVEEYIDILRHIRDSETLSNLTISSSHDEITRATVFVDPDDNAFLAVRGTGGVFIGWVDNLRSFNISMTGAQKEFDVFIEEVSGKYTLVAGTGHSQGSSLLESWLLRNPEFFH